MNILFYHPYNDPTPYIEGIPQRLPGANVRVWQPSDNEPADYAIVWMPPNEMLIGRKGLRAVFTLGAGVDAIVEQIRQHPDMLPEGVPLVRLEDAGMARQMEEYVSAAVLRYFRRMDEYHILQHQQRWKFLEPHTYENFVIGVMGLGVLGSRVAQRLASFGFSVRGWSRSQKNIKDIECYSGEQFDDFSHQAKVIVNLLPNTPDTQGILNKALFSRLQKGAYIINVARGAHLIEEDLLEALDAGQLKSATLDVFSSEPLSRQHVFWQRSDIIMTPHISAITLPQMTMDQICRRLRAFQAGEAISGVVDINRGY